jgi:hypothetical protein
MPRSIAGTARSSRTGTAMTAIRLRARIAGLCRAMVNV